MKKRPSIARIDRKYKVCEMGEELNALVIWLRLAPRVNHYNGFSQHNSVLHVEFPTRNRNLYVPCRATLGVSIPQPL
jgi:hypothetical protein